MALTIKQLNGDASFLLTFEPIDTSDVALSTQPFHVLLDPWISNPGSSSGSAAGAGVHTNFWSTAHAQPACIDSLQDLPEIDLIVISSARSDHCHEATLRQLPARNTKTRILAEPAAARRIRSWRYFAADKIEALPRWEETKQTTTPDKEKVLRIPILPQVFGGEPGEVTLTYIGQRRETHGAVGITYRPPTVSPTVFRRSRMPSSTGTSPIPPCPPRLPTPALSFSDSGSSTPGSPASSIGSMSPTLVPAPLSCAAGGGTPGSRRRRCSGRTVQSCATWRSLRTLSPHNRDRGVSVVFSPHGIPYAGALQSYATTHLLSQAVLPLTALLHCFDSYSQPWFLGGTNNSAGMPMGQETAAALGAKAWISAHDGDKDVRGVVSRLVKKRRYLADEVQRTLDASFAQGMASPGNMLKRSPNYHPTEVLALEVGEEIAMTSEGIWEEDTLFADEKPLDMHGLGLSLDEGAEDQILTGAPPPVDWLGAEWHSLTT